MTIRFVLNYHVVHDDALKYLGMCSLSSFEDYKKLKRCAVGVKLWESIFRIQTEVSEFFELDFRLAESISFRMTISNIYFDEFLIFLFYSFFYFLHFLLPFSFFLGFILFDFVLYFFEYKRERMPSAVLYSHSTKFSASD